MRRWIAGPCACLGLMAGLAVPAGARDVPVWRMPESAGDLAESRVLPLTESELPAFVARVETDPARREALIRVLHKASVVPWTPAEREAFVAEMGRLQQCEAGRDRDDGKLDERLDLAIASGELERLIRDYARLMDAPELVEPLDAPTCGRPELMRQMRRMATLPMAATLPGTAASPQPAHRLRVDGLERLLGAQMMGGRCAPSETFIRLLMTTPDNPKGLRTADAQLRCKGPAYTELWNEAEHARMMEAMPQVRRCLALGNDPKFDLDGARARFATSPELPRLFDAAYELLGHVGVSKSFGYELPVDPQERSGDLEVAMANVGLLVEKYHDGAELTSPAAARQLQATGLLALYVARLAPETCTLPNDFVPLLKLNSLADPS